MTQRLPTLEQLAATFDTDKAESQNYLRHYRRYFEELREQPVALLELGVLRGGSLQLWDAYFQKGSITGIDINPNPLSVTPERVRFFQGSQADAGFLSSVARERAPGGFDIIIDDASHVGTLSRTTFLTLFTNHLKRGGIYVIEDWGTGYWEPWPDGRKYERPPAAGLREQLKQEVAERLDRTLRPGQTDPDFPTHNFGMVGFVKQLVDWLAWSDISRPDRGVANLPCPVPAIRELAFFPGQAFLIKD